MQSGSVSDHDDAVAASTPGPTGYVARRLRYEDRSGVSHTVDEAGLIALPGPKVILGEPGMGKTALVREVGRRLGVAPVAAIRFMLAKDPSRFVGSGGQLLIDGLDEAMARREGDAVDQILAQLEGIGAPDLILSCRARDWQARSANALRGIYGTDPTVLVLDAFARDEALAFLRSRNPQADAHHVLDHLDAHGLPDIYHSPLSLSLIGRVAETDRHLPLTRSALFERVCVLIWPEHDPDRQDRGLAQLGMERALSAAGALAAGLLLAGAEAIGLTGPAQAADGDVRLSELSQLPGAEMAPVVVSSKLFVSVDVARAKPVHRVIAEYLGARWLARSAASSRAQRRLLAQLQGNGVPASLRGLHAWLAIHSPAMAERVIAADPYGVLRYADTAVLTPVQIDHLFEALCALAAEDPYFRRHDWTGHTAAGLAVPALRGRIETVIASASSNGHLRMLLIEAVRGLSMAADIAGTLERITLSDDRFYGEREAAADALWPHRDQDWWQCTVAALRDRGTVDAARLARHLIDRTGHDVDDELLVSTLFAELGALLCPLPRESVRQRDIWHGYDRLVRDLPTGRLSGVLDRMGDYAALLRRDDWRSWHDVGDVMARLMARAIEEGAVGPDDAPGLWRWLGPLVHANQGRTSLTALWALLAARDDLRRAIQRHALSVDRRGRTLRAVEWDLHHRMVGLSGRPADVALLLAAMDDADNRDEVAREDWCELVRLGVVAGTLHPDVRAAALRFQGTDDALAAHLRRLERPRPSHWELKQARAASKRERKRRARFEADRRHFAARCPDIQAGVLAGILGPARAYLGQFAEFGADLPPAERIAAWLGAALRDAALVGFEAALARDDLPGMEAVLDGLARGTLYNYCHVILAALLARHRAGRSLADVPPAVLDVGLLICLNDIVPCVDKDVDALRMALEAVAVATPERRTAFARRWIEPALRARRVHVPGLYRLAHDSDWQATGRALAGEWLHTFPDLPATVEPELVDCITHVSTLPTLAAVAAARAQAGYRDEAHRLAWCAVDVLVRFDAVRPDLDGIASRHPDFIWYLRNRFQVSRGDAGLAVPVDQARWIVSTFRRAWPYAELRGVGTGNTNPYDATDFLRAMLGHLANDTGEAASAALLALAAEPEDTYTALIRHMAAEQRQKRLEEAFEPLAPAALGALMAEGPPSNADDLKTLVQEELAVAQAKLRGDDLDQVRDFWSDDGVPYDENRCRDRLAALIGPELARYGVQRITEADMPQAKRADLAFACGSLQLPMEVKGQWHPKVWDAATGQLDARYLIDWRSEGRGLYCVLWFGELSRASGRRLRPPPDGSSVPSTAEAMRRMLVDRIPEAKRRYIEVVVLDLTAGGP